ncbi:hypothetical protein JCM10213v2_005891 [Rhodosporidiobolus nylandii]
MAVGTYVHRRIAMEKRSTEHVTSWMTSESPIAYSPASYTSPPPQHGLTLDDILRAASDEDRKEKAERKAALRGTSSTSTNDSEGDDRVEKETVAVSRAPSYRSQRTAPPAYEASDSDPQLEAEYAAQAQLSEKQQGKRRAREDPGDWV